MLLKSFALQLFDLCILRCQLLIQALNELSLLLRIICNLLRLRFMIWLDRLLFIFILFLFSKKFSYLLITLLDRVMELFLLEFRPFDFSFSILKVFRLLFEIFYIVSDQKIEKIYRFSAMLSNESLKIQKCLTLNFAKAICRIYRWLWFKTFRLTGLQECLRFFVKRLIEFVESLWFLLVR